MSGLKYQKFGKGETAMDKYKLMDLIYDKLADNTELCGEEEE